MRMRYRCWVKFGGFEKRFFGLEMRMRYIQVVLGVLPARTWRYFPTVVSGARSLVRAR
jgi:hypothetical protein